LTLISGANLPMVLSFVTKRDSMDLQELTEAIKRDGIRGIERLKL